MRVSEIRVKWIRVNRVFQSDETWFCLIQRLCQIFSHKTILQNFNSWIIKLTKTQIFQNCQVSNGHFCCTVNLCLFHLLVQKYFDHAQIFLTKFNIFWMCSIFFTLVKNDILPCKFAYLSMVKNIWPHSNNIECGKKFLNATNFIFEPADGLGVNHSRIEVLQNCPAFLSVSLLKTNT